MKKIKNITRTEALHREGWIVKLSRGDKVLRKYFSDHRYGGKTKALVLAKECLDGFKAILHVNGNERVLPTIKNRGTTGVQGVSERIQVHPKTQEKRYTYVVSWQETPTLKKYKTFSSLKHGKEQAFELAVEWRKSVVEKIYSSPKV